MLGLFRKRWRERRPIKAVHEQDLEDFLRSLKLPCQPQSQLGSCIVCGDAVGTQNLGAVSPGHGGVDVICDRTQCVARVLTDHEKDEK